MKKDCALGIDFGTQSVRIIVFDSKGNTLVIFEPDQRILDDMKKYTKNLSA